MLRTRIEYYQLIIDIVLAVAALYASYVIRSAVPLGRQTIAEMLVVPQQLYVIVLAIWLLMFYQYDVYVRKFGTKFRFRILNLLRSHAIASFLYLGVLYLTYRDVSRLQSLYFIAMFAAGTVVSRVVIRLVEIKFLERDDNRFHVVIIGTNLSAARLIARIRENPRNNLKVVGIFSLRDVEPPSGELLHDLLGTVDDVPKFIRHQHVDEVIIASNWYSEVVAQQISKIMYDLQPFPVAIRLAPDYSDLSYFHVVTEDFEGLPLIGLRTPIFSPSQRLLKRWLDIVVSLTIVILGSPVFALVALAIRWDSRGPIILRQQRVGIHGRTFSMYKFRSMYDKIDQNKFDETELDVIKRPEDPRVTRVGRFLRRTSLDELPQLMNVIKGDMSLVGPRPELPSRVQTYEWWQFKRLEVPQGMTGWWQINGRANRPMHLHTEDDLYYIQNYSLWLDLRILWQTARVVITGEGAF